MPHNLKCSQMMDVQMDEKLTGKCENDWSMNNSVTFYQVAWQIVAQKGDAHKKPHKQLCEQNCIE